MSNEREQRGSPPAHATGAVQFVAVDDIAVDETFRLRPDGDVSQLATALGRLGQLSPVELRPWPGAGSDGARWQVVSGFRRLAAVRMLARERVLARLHHDLAEEDAWNLAIGEALLHEPLTGEDLEVLRTRLRASGVAPWAEELVDEALVRAPVSAELRERFYDFLIAGAAATPAQIEASTPNPAAALSAHLLADASELSAWTSPSWESGAPPPAAAPVAQSLADASEPPASPPSESGAPPPIPPEDAPREAVETEPVEDYIEVTPDELVQDLAARLSALNQDLATAVEAWKDLPPEGRKVILDQARYVAALLPFMETLE